MECLNILNRKNFRKMPQKSLKSKIKCIKISKKDPNQKWFLKKYIFKTFRFQFVTFGELKLRFLKSFYSEYIFSFRIKKFFNFLTNNEMTFVLKYGTKKTNSIIELQLETVVDMCKQSNRAQRIQQIAGNKRGSIRRRSSG